MTSKTGPESELWDQQRTLIAKLFTGTAPTCRAGRPMVHPHPCLEGILRTGTCWKDLPSVSRVQPPVGGSVQKGVGSGPPSGGVVRCNYLWRHPAAFRRPFISDWPPPFMSITHRLRSCDASGVFPCIIHKLESLQMNRRFT